MTKISKIISVTIFFIVIIGFCSVPQAKADFSAGAGASSNPPVNIQAGNISGGTVSAGGNVVSGGVINAGGNVVSGGTINASASANSTKGTTASSCSAPKDIGTLFDFARCVLSSSVVPFIIALGVVIFLAGVVRYVAAGDNEEKREASRNLMLYGIIAIFVMVSVWGFVKMLSTTFGFDYSLPSLPPSKNNPALNS